LAAASAASVSLPNLGTGSEVNIWSNATEGASISAVQGSAGTRDGTFNPPIKASRILEVTQASTNGVVTGDGSENFAAIHGAVQGATNCQVQAVGVAGFAANVCATDPGTVADQNPDACGIYGVGRVNSGGVGVGIGAFFRGQRDGSTGYYTGVEIQTYNGHTVATTYSSTAFTSSAIWMNAVGNEDTAVGLLFGQPFGRQFDYGIAANRQVSGGKTGGIKTALIYDESSATWSYKIAGSKTGGIDTTGATFSGNFALSMANGHLAGWGDVALSRGSAGRVKVTDASSGYGELDAGGLLVGGKRVARYAAKATKASNQTAVDFTAGVMVTWDTDSFDDGAWHSTSTNTSRMTVPADVDRVRIGACVRLSGVTSGSPVTMTLVKNGATTVASNLTSTTTTTPSVSIATMDACTAGDYYEVNIYVNDSSADITAAGSNFWIEAA
jgi:hypothetical protein